MNTKKIVFRKAIERDVDFMSEILIDAAAASGVNLSIHDLSRYPDTYQYVQGFPEGSDIGIIAETPEKPIGAAWVRMLPTDAHAVNHPMHELTMGVIPEYRRMGIAERLMEELYKAASEMNVPEICLGVHKDNLPAINLYRKQGWVEDGSFKEYIMMSRSTDI